MLNPEAPRARYVEIDGQWHEIGEDEHTTSGLVIPPLATWVEELPEGANLQTVQTDEPAEKPKAAKPKSKAKKG